MENSVWRIWARVVAYINLISAVFTALFYVFAFGIGVWMSTLSDAEFKHYLNELNKYELNEYGTHDVENIGSVLLFIYWIMMAIFTVALVIQFWLTIILLKATKYGAESRKALHQSTTWRNVNLFFVVLLLCLLLITLISGDSMTGPNLWRLLFNIVVEFLFLFIVHSFIKELKLDVETQTGGSFRYHQKAMV